MAAGAGSSFLVLAALVTGAPAAPAADPVAAPVGCADSGWVSAAQQLAAAVADPQGPRPAVLGRGLAEAGFAASGAGPAAVAPSGNAAAAASREQRMRTLAAQLGEQIALDPSPRAQRLAGELAGLSNSAAAAGPVAGEAPWEQMARRLAATVAGSADPRARQLGAALAEAGFSAPQPWEQAAEQLATIAAASEDPRARELSDTLAGLGFGAGSPDASDGSSPSTAGPAVGCAPAPAVPGQRSGPAAGFDRGSTSSDEDRFGPVDPVAVRPGTSRGRGASAFGSEPPSADGSRSRPVPSRPEGDGSTGSTGRSSGPSRYGAEDEGSRARPSAPGGSGGAEDPAAGARPGDEREDEQQDGPGPRDSDDGQGTGDGDDDRGGNAGGQDSGPRRARPSVPGDGGAASPGTVASVVPVSTRPILDLAADGVEQLNCQNAVVNGDCSQENLDASGSSAQVLPDGEGGLVARFEVGPGDVPDFGGGERSEFSAQGLEDGMSREGDERWYEFSLRFDEDFQAPQGDWFIVMQWHAGDGSPPLALEVNPAGELFAGGDGVDHNADVIAAVEPGTTVNYAVQVGFSPDPAQGFVRALADGVEVLPEVRRATMSSGENYLKFGIYRDADDSVAGVEIGNLRVFDPGVGGGQGDPDIEDGRSAPPGGEPDPDSEGDGDGGSEQGGGQ